MSNKFSCNMEFNANKKNVVKSLNASYIINVKFLMVDLNFYENFIVIKKN